MARERVLVVEDEEDIQELVRFNLNRAGYRVDSAFTGEEGLRMARRDSPHLVLLDLMLPGVDGLEVCRLLRGDPGTAHLPIMMVTARGEESDIVAGLELGADDYLTKPFSPRVLLARVAALLRRDRTPAPDDSPIGIHGIAIDPVRRVVRVGGRPVTLTQAEFDMLRCLARQPGRVFTRPQIVSAVHGEDYPVTDRSVDVQIVGLRKKLGSAGKEIETVRGVGYRMRE